MHIQWQMVGQQADIVGQQGFQPPLLHTGDAGVFALPEIAVVHQQHIRTRLDGGFDEGQAGCHAADHALYLRPALDLQPVGAIITDARSIQIAFGFRYQGRQSDGHIVSSRAVANRCFIGRRFL